MKKLQAIALIFVIVIVVSFGSYLYIISNQSEPVDPYIPEDPVDPYVKGWEDFNIYLSTNDYYLLNYTIPQGYVYRNFCSDFYSGSYHSQNYPPIYAVSSEFVDEFKEVLGGFFNPDTNPIMENIFAFETVRWAGNDYGFYPPYLDIWYIFIVSGCVSGFTYSDAIQLPH